MLQKLEDSEVKISVDSKAEKPNGIQEEFTVTCRSFLLFAN